MSIEIYAALAPEVAETAAAEPATSQWIETAIAVVFTASAVSLVSFIAVIAVLVSAGASLRVQCPCADLPRLRRAGRDRCSD